MTETQVLRSRKQGRKELRRLQRELIKLQYWIQACGLRVVVLFEGRDAAGKGGVIRRITHYTNPRIVQVVALPAPTEQERSQWYFQRYVAHLPSAGRMALFDRSWYNRAGVETVMGFCSREQLQEFFVSCPQFEDMLIRSGIRLIKYWFSVSDEEQERRFQARLDEPLKRWKLSPMDLASRSRWQAYSRAQDEMFAHCHTDPSPWHLVDSNNKELARLNCIHHLLSQFDYEDLTPPAVELPPRPAPGDDKSGAGALPPFVPETYRFKDKDGDTGS